MKVSYICTKEGNTTAIVATMYFKGNFCMSSRFLYDGQYTWNYYAKIRTMLAKQDFDETGLRAALKTWIGSDA
jgi:hypothetical protein